MKIALYKGRSLIPSRAIEFLTRSEYSHVAFVFDQGTTDAIQSMIGANENLGLLHYVDPGAVIEAWSPGGVRNTLSVGSQHDPKTPVEIYRLKKPLTQSEEIRLTRLLISQLGDDYGWTNVFRFITKRPGKEDGSWFCSELCFHDLKEIGRILLSHTEAWEVPPDWFHRMNELEFEESIVT